VADISGDDSLGDHDGFVDPGETVSIRVELVNPWRQASRQVPSATATLKSSTQGVMISDKTSTYGPIPAQGSAVWRPLHLFGQSGRRLRPTP